MSDIPTVFHRLRLLHPYSFIFYVGIFSYSSFLLIVVFIIKSIFFGGEFYFIKIISMVLSLFMSDTAVYYYI